MGGRLIATVPIGSVCYKTSQFSDYDAGKCSNVQANWESPQQHIDTSHSVQAAFWANASCDPFLADNGRCVTGTYVSYAVKATGADDYRKTIAFATKRNIRLVIRNTAHDHLGKSTGAGALAIWTHNLKDTKVSDYKSKYYTGKAIKFGAGVEIFEANAAAHAQGLAVVGSSGDTVGLAGGYTQGGGTGPAVSAWGLAADQVLEWEVVTADGTLLTATPAQNADLYWALSGGGGGTYGVVLSMTVRAYQDIPTSAANLAFSADGVPQATFADILKTFITIIPKINDAGGNAVWEVFGSAFAIAPVTAPGLAEADLKKILNPVIAKLNSSKIPYG